MIDEKRIEYRLKNLVFSQNLFNTWNRSKKEFFDKYIMDIFWSDETERDRLYDKNMVFGRNFHTMCQRVFLDIPPYLEKDVHNNLVSNIEIENLKKIKNIKTKYQEKYADRVKFFPEFEIKLNNGVYVILDLLIVVYHHIQKENNDISLKSDGNVLEKSNDILKKTLFESNYDLLSNNLIDNDFIEKIDIWDWKTEGKKIEDIDANRKMQSVVYLYACGETIGKNIDCKNITMHYYQPHINNNVIVEYSNQKHDKNIVKINNLIREIQENRIWE